jgi:hypothetical protein
MKTIKLFVVLLVVLASHYGCYRSVFTGGGRYKLQFKQEHTFPPSENPLLEVFGGTGLHIIDTLLLVQRQHENPSYYWEIYNLNSLKHVKSILRHGRGPSEVLFVNYAGQHEKINGEEWMFFSDVNSAKFLKINLTESVHSGKDIVELMSPIDPVKSPYFAIDNDALLYCEYDQEDGNIRLMTCDRSLKNPSMLKEICQNVTPDDSWKLVHYIGYSENNNKVCIAPYYVDHIQIIDLESNKDMVLSTAKSDNWPTVREQDFTDLTLFYSGIRTTDDYIFTLYYDKKISEMVNSPKETEIHVFDWDGDAVARLCFEDHIASFAVDMKNKVLYGINHMEQIYAYNVEPYLP